MRAGLAPASGSVVAGFRLDRWLGGGDDTEVWRADGDGIVVALKLLRDPSDVFARARMAREAAALRRIDDPHVVPLFAVGEEDGEPYLATPLLDAGTLAHLLDDGRLDEDVAAAILAPVALALAAAHAAGVVHRDVKPGNVMLTADGPVLVDFGAAALDGVTLDGWLEGAPALVATTAYAPPEIEVSPAVDVWSLGVMLLEALTGRTDVRAALDRGLPEVSARARALIERCCASDPTLRPAAALLAEELQSLGGTATAAPSVPAPIVLDDDAPGRRLTPYIPDTFGGRAALSMHHGRELEVAQLLDMVDAAQAAHELRGVLVTAPPGMGKSWLLDTAATRAALDGATVLRAACTEAVNDLRVLAPWVRRVGDHARLIELLGEHHADLVVHVTGVESGGSVEADPATIADAMAALVGACERPVAVVDDLHHAAADLVDLLGRLAFRPGISGALWLGARPNVVDGDDLDVRTFALGPLPDDVIVDLAGAEAVELAGGNPLLARELVLARAQAHEQAPALAPLSAGTTDVRELIGQRLARVGSTAGAELDLAATCGEVFWPETIGVTAALGLMCRSGLVRLRPDSTIAGSTEAEWTHPLLREVAYDRLGNGTRRDAHVVVAHKLDDAATEPEAIAHHAAAAFELGAIDESAFVGDVSARAASGGPRSLRARPTPTAGRRSCARPVASRYRERPTRSKPSCCCAAASSSAAAPSPTAGLTGPTTSAPKRWRSAPRRTWRRASTTPPSTLPRQRSPASPTAGAATNSRAPTSSSSNEEATTNKRPTLAAAAAAGSTNKRRRTYSRHALRCSELSTAVTSRTSERRCASVPSSGRGSSGRGTRVVSATAAPLRSRVEKSRPPW